VRMVWREGPRRCDYRGWATSSLRPSPTTRPLISASREKAESQLSSIADFFYAASLNPGRHRRLKRAFPTASSLLLRQPRTISTSHDHGQAVNISRMGPTEER
jgi:hypothetical protein